MLVYKNKKLYFTNFYYTNYVGKEKFFLTEQIYLNN
jgi:hypothetical protein